MHPIPFQHDRLPMQLLMALLAATMMFFVVRWGPIRDAEELTLDARFSNFPRPDLADSSVVIVAIDNGSLDLLAENGLNWPWSRDIYAHAIEVLEAAGAKAVLFDLLFYDSDIDRYEVDPVYSDGMFSSRLAASDITVIGTELLPKFEQTVELPQSLLLDAGTAPFEPLMTFEGVRLPYGPFTEAANHIAATNVIPDAGGIIRQTHLIYNYHGRIIPNVAVRTLIATGETDVLSSYSSAKQRIYWYGSAGPEGVFRYIPFSALIQAGDEVNALLDGKIVVIGAYASGLLDFKPTPVSDGNAYPGVEIWATVISNLLNGHFVRPIAGWIQWVMFFGLAFLTLQTFRVRRTWQGVLLSVVLLGAFVMASLFAWSHGQLPVHMTGGLLTIALVFTANSVVKYVAEGRAKNEIRTIFSRYVHPDVIETLTRQPDKIVMGGDIVNASILFTDIANFTTYAETRRADVLVPELNAYLSVLTEAVLDEGGLLDKFTGDGIMALYGVPLHASDHAVRACRTALRHLAYTDSLHPDRTSESDLFFHQHTRIGINTGDIIAGNIGSSRRMDFTAIGDDVNLAARLEGVNKVYGTRIIIGETTREQIGDTFVVRELDSITVKGKANPVRIFELVAEVGTPETLSWIRDYEEGLLWYREGDWSKAEPRFLELASRHPNDKASSVMAERCATLRALSPSDWDGVFRIQSK